jgi:hypothetical protein
MPDAAKRNRSAEARAKGQILRAFTLSRKADRAIDHAQRLLARAEIPRCSKVQALESLIFRGIADLEKKEKILPSGLDRD